MRTEKRWRQFGAAAGSIIGYAIDDGAGGVIAVPAVGSAGGAGVGRYKWMTTTWNEWGRWLRNKARNELQMPATARNESWKLIFQTKWVFDFDSSSNQKPAIWNRQLNKVADVLQRYPQNIIHVIGL